MVNSDALLESKSLRESVIDKIGVLEKVKKLAMLPDDIHVTVEMAASYYGVGKTAISTILDRHKDEFESDGVRTITSKDEGFFVLQKALNQSQFIVKVIPRRAVLRIGMLLRDSLVAKSIRNYLLDFESVGRVSTPFTEFDQVTKLLQMLRLGNRDNLFNEATDRAIRKQVAEMMLGQPIPIDAPAERVTNDTDHNERPQWVKDGYGAKVIGLMCGVSAVKVGVWAKKHGLQTEKYGDWYRYTSKGKAHAIFIYNEAGKDKLVKLLKNNHSEAEKTGD